MRKRITIDEALAKDISWAISVGNPVDDACRAYDVTVRQWEKALKENPSFRVILEAAKSKFLVHATRDIAAGNRNWKSLTWLLERMHPERYGRPPPVQITNNTTNSNTFFVTEEFCNSINEAFRSAATPQPVRDN